MTLGSFLICQTGLIPLIEWFLKKWKVLSYTKDVTMDSSGLTSISPATINYLLGASSGLG